ncbi:MAG: adenylate/guanylate cyclase domain-containing protein [Leptolyngbyaceae cyanobacterium bins.302]|nr:adenylate/guanylate cyclase domain-containing protein [Leptolyngbyaceae cyanobacterium bins.302]
MLNLKFQASLRSQLMVMLLTVSVCAMFAIAYLCYHSGETNLTNRIFSQLTSVRASKAYQIQAYFENIQAQTQALSEDLMMVNAMKEFETAYHQLETTSIPAEWDGAIDTYYQHEYLPKLAKLHEGTPIPALYQPTTAAARYLQYHYIANNPNPVGKKHLLDDANDGSSYSQVHAKYHPVLEKFHDRFGYYDLFLIDAESGAIVYSIFKEVDYGTSLFSGPYNNSNLAKAVAAAIEAKGTGYTKIVDFDQYKPSYGSPAAFIAAPIFDHSSFIGVLALQFPVDEINRVMTGNKNWKDDGLGDSGETYLVGQDHTMRSVSRFLIEEPERYLELLQNIHVSEDTIEAMQRFGTSILQQEVNTTAVQEALAQREGTRVVNDYRGIPVLSSYAPLDIPGLNWAILAEMDLAEAYAPVYTFQRVILIWATLIILLITVASMVLSYIFIKPINTLITSAKKIGEGEVDALVTLNSQDEFGELAHAFNDMVHSLQAKTDMIEQKNRENEELLLNIFPAAVAKRLKAGEKDIADQVSNVTVLFADVTGFTDLSESMNVYEAVKTLNDLVTTFDEATERFGVEKIKTSGDNYMAVCGLSAPRLDHMNRTIDFAVEVRSLVRRFNYEKGCQLDVKISIHSGDVIAGIVGRKKVIYDVWGDTVNAANIILARSPANPGGILVSQIVHDYLQDLYDFEWVDNLNQHSEQELGVWRLKSAGKRGAEV